MKYFILVFLLIKSFQISFGQFRPILYDLEVPGSVFYNLTSHNDTLYCYGMSSDSIQKKWVISVVAIDTLGKVINQNNFSDTAVNYYSAFPNYGIIKTSDGGIGIVGIGISNKYKSFFLKVNKFGKLDILKSYIDTIYYPVYLSEIVETNSGYFIAGHRTNNQSIHKSFLFFLNKNGEIINEKSYSINKYGEIIDELIKVNNNKFFITGTIGYSDTSSKSRILTIDSLGNVINTWYSKENEHLGIRKMILLSDSCMIYTTVKYKIINNDGIQKTLLVKRDKNMNVLWQKTFNQEWSMYYNRPIELKEMPDGNFILAYDKVSIKSSTKPDVLLSCLFKFNSNGDSIWSREDTVIYSEKFGVENNIGGITVLPSGNIVVCGYSNAPINGSVRSIAWLYKVNKDGCMDFCNTTGFLDLGETEQKVKVFPNPTTDEFTISSITELNQVEIYNSFGQQIFKKETLNNHLNIKTFDWKNGLYFITIKDNNGSIYTTKLVVHHAL